MVIQTFVGRSCGIAAFGPAAGDHAFADRWLENAVLALLDAPGADIVYGGRPELMD